MSDMLAARLHKIGDPMQLERVPNPEPRPTDVVVQVTAAEPNGAAVPGSPIRYVLRVQIE